MRLIRVENDAALERFARAGSPCPPSSVGAVRDDDADEHWMVEAAGGAVVARVSLWWTRVPAYAAQRPGVLGHYAAVDDASARMLLAAACERLRAHGCTLAIGPMDGNTWRRYRFVVERGDEPPFLFDIDQPDAWPQQFERAGFRRMAMYASSVDPDVSRRHAREDEWEAAARAHGVRLRALDPARFEAEMRRIFQVSLAAFERNLLYTPIDEATFLRLYRPVSTSVRPELVLLAERGEETVGFVFCMPDLLAAKRTGRIETMVLKTIAVHPQAMNLRLGSHLVARARRAAHELGLRRMIIAFMHEDNPSLRISAHFGPVIRRYALYSKELGA